MLDYYFIMHDSDRRIVEINDDVIGNFGPKGVNNILTRT